MSSSQTLGEIVRELRETRGLTQAQLAERAQVALSFVTMIEGGQQPNTSKQILLRIADTFGIFRFVIRSSS